MHTVPASPARPQRQPVTVCCETVRRGRVESAEARVRWLARPEPRTVGYGWHRGAVEISGTAYAIEATFTHDGDGRHWLVVDLRKADGTHYRLTLGQGE